MAEREIRRAEDPIRFLQMRGLSLAAELGVDGGLINEAVGIVVNALGEDWLRRAAHDVPKGGGLPFRRHPIGDLISTAGATQLVELMELAEYLKSAALSPAFGALMNGLKADYHSTVLQLAFGHRFRRAGAQDVVYEPPSTEGRFGDLGFTVEKQRYVAECYRPHVKPVDMNSCWLLAQQALEALRDRPIVLAVAIQLHRMPSPEDRRELAGVVYQAARRVEEAPAGTSDLVCELLRSDLASVSVCRSISTPPGAAPILVRPAQFPRQGNDWRIFLRVSHASIEILTHVQPQVEPGRGRSHVGIWLPPDEEEEPVGERDLAEPLEKLGRKLESKLAQARSAAEGRRVLVANTWIAEELDRADSTVLDRLRGKLLVAHRGVAGVFLVRRGWRHARRACRFTIRPLLPPGDAGLPASFVDVLRKQEGD